MPFGGDLSNMSMVQVFQLLAKTRKEGTLTVTDGLRTKVVHFGGGAMRLIALELGKALRMNDLLSRCAKIPKDRLDTALRIQKDSGGKLPDVLEQMGVLKASELQDVLRQQVKEEIYDLFHWPKATFEFVEAAAPAELTVVRSKAAELAIDIDSFLLDALRARDEKVRDTERMTRETSTLPDGHLRAPGVGPAPPAAQWGA